MGTATHCHVCGRKLPEHTDPHIYHDQSIYQERYKVLAQEIERVMGYTSDKSQPKPARLAAVSELRGILDACLDDENLDHLTRIYRDTHPHTKVNVGYNQYAVTAFAMEMLGLYT